MVHKSRRVERSAGLPPPRGIRGFTLLELTITMVALALITALVAGGFQQWLAPMEVRGAADLLASDLRIASAGAQAAQARVRLVFLLEEGKTETEEVPRVVGWKTFVFHIPSGDLPVDVWTEAHPDTLASSAHLLPATFSVRPESRVGRWITAKHLPANRTLPTSASLTASVLDDFFALDEVEYGLAWSDPPDVVWALAPEPGGNPFSPFPPDYSMLPVEEEATLVHEPFAPSEPVYHPGESRVTTCGILFPATAIEHFLRSPTAQMRRLPFIEFNRQGRVIGRRGQETLRFSVRHKHQSHLQVEVIFDPLLGTSALVP